jgi:hypothetical protein
MNPFLARIAMLVVFASGCGGVETGSSGKGHDATVEDGDGADSALDGAVRDGGTFCPASGCFDTGGGSWCTPDEFCISTGSQPTCPMACCLLNDARAIVTCRP